MTAILLTISRIAAVFAQDGPSVMDNEVLDEFRLPFGDWILQGVEWSLKNLKWLFNWIKWPFEAMFNLLLEAKFTGFPWEDSKASAADPIFDLNLGLVELPWLVVVGAMSLIALLVRGGKIAVFTAVALTMCGMLGEDHWFESAKTIGFVLVAVVLSALVGIPLGVACGRIDGLWAAVRPTLDAMQVVHSFVYMLGLRAAASGSLDEPRYQAGS